ncbi:phiSA1p31-related protein [Streptomyces hydrogenans]|uniref:phiSA1p31-related protein n=1 Tax=Streptomyces hydrogenans TaxID=1873719 RepID=UPI0035E19093
MTDTFKVGDKVRHESYGDVEITYGPYPGEFSDARFLVRGEDGRERVAVPERMTAIPKFVVGDKVHAAYGSGGTLVSGPFKSAHHEEAIWVVEKADGTHVFPTAGVLTKVEPEPARDIKVGDRVRVTDDDCGGRRFGGRIGTVKTIHRAGTLLPYLVEFGDGRGHHGDPNGRWNCRTVELLDETADTYTHDGVTYDLSARYRDRDGDPWQFKRLGDRVTGACGAEPEDDSWTLGYIVERYGPLTRCR